MMLTVRKCDRGIPLPEGSLGTWYTWDTWDDETGRSVSQHRTREAAQRAADLMNDEPHYRALLEVILARLGSHTAILEGLRTAAAIASTDLKATADAYLAAFPGATEEHGER